MLAPSLHEPLDYCLGKITRVWLRAIACVVLFPDHLKARWSGNKNIARGVQGQPSRGCNFCHVTIIRKWLPNMGMLSSASTFCLFEKMPKMPLRQIIRGSDYS